MAASFSDFGISLMLTRRIREMNYRRVMEFLQIAYRGSP